MGTIFCALWRFLTLYFYFSNICVYGIVGLFIHACKKNARDAATSTYIPISDGVNAFRDNINSRISCRTIRS